jgi:hypothetical protein
MATCAESCPDMDRATVLPPARLSEEKFAQVITQAIEGLPGQFLLLSSKGKVLFDCDLARATGRARTGSAPPCTSHRASVAIDRIIARDERALSA